MNILELCLSPHLGGLELYAETATKELSKTENVTVVLRDSGKLNERARKEERTFFFLPKSFHNFPFINAYKLSKVIDKKRIQIIHVHWSKDLFLSVLGKIFSNSKPKIIYHRQMQIPSEKKGLYHSFIYKHVDLMLCITQNLVNEGKRYLPKAFEERIELLYYGVKEPKEMLSQERRAEIRKAYGFSQNDYVVGLFGRIEEIKGQYLLLEALSKINESEIKGLIVGRAMEEEYLDALKIEAKNLCKEKVVFEDFVDNPVELMQSCEVVLLATKNETFGLVLAEAMLSHTPIIGSDQGGVLEIVGSDESRGLMFASLDASSLQSKLEYAFTHKEQMREKSEKALLFAREHFNYENHFTILQEKMRKILKI